MWIFLGVLAVLILFVAVFAFYAYYVTFFVSNKEKRADPIPPEGKVYDPYHELMCEGIARMKDIPCEWVSIRSRDGKRLWARYYHAADGAPLRILVHGYRGTVERDFSGGLPFALGQGNNVLAIEHRGHGRSDGHTITFGLKERYDLLDWIHFSIDKFGADTSIVLSGISMGSAVVLFASGMEELPPQVKCILADCPYSSPAELIRLVASRRGFPPKLVYPFIQLGALLYGHFRLTDERVVDAVRRSRVPILLVHSDGDDFVPCYMSIEIAKANPEKVRLEIFHADGHGISFYADLPRYRKIIEEFFAEHLSN